MIMERMLRAVGVFVYAYVFGVHVICSCMNVHGRVGECVLRPFSVLRYVDARMLPTGERIE